jgi:hypothetical protein
LVEVTFLMISLLVGLVFLFMEEAVILFFLLLLLNDSQIIMEFIKSVSGYLWVIKRYCF